ncbi:MAG: hypothetical protein ACI4Q3_00430 [Kiritimatiellia bacterium]
MATEKKHYLVETHVGPQETWATSPKKAIAQVRYRLVGGAFAGTCRTTYWTVKEIA